MVILPQFHIDPAKERVFEDYFPLKMGYVQGQRVSLVQGQSPFVQYAALKIAKSNFTMLIILVYLYPRKSTNKCSFERFLLFEPFFSTRAFYCTTFGIFALCAFDAKNMSVFPWETSVNTREKNVNTHPSKFRCGFSSSSEHKNSE